MIRFPFLAAIALFVAACAAPYDMPANDRADMQARIDSFQQAIIRDDFDTVIDVVPPKVVQGISQRSGVPAKTLRQGLIDLARRSSKSVKIESFGMATDRATYGQTPGGRGYAVVPTQTTFVDTTGTRRQGNTNTLAFKDDGNWYLVRVEDQDQVDLLKQAYPEFGNVRFPKGSVKIIE